MCAGNSVIFCNVCLSGYCSELCMSNDTDHSLICDQDFHIRIHRIGKLCNGRNSVLVGHSIIDETLRYMTRIVSNSTCFICGIVTNVELGSTAWNWGDNKTFQITRCVKCTGNGKSLCRHSILPIDICVDSVMKKCTEKMMLIRVLTEPLILELRTLIVETFLYTYPDICRLYSLGATKHVCK